MAEAKIGRATQGQHRQSNKRLLSIPKGVPCGRAQGNAGSAQTVQQDNTLVLLIEIGAPLKKPSSETTYFELLVLAFRVSKEQSGKQ